MEIGYYEEHEMIFYFSKYKTYGKKYGKPALTAFGEHVWEQVPEKFVRDITGKVMERTREVRYLGSNNDRTLHFYLGPKAKLKEGDAAIPSFNG